jgi:hypothetical protein
MWQVQGLVTVLGEWTVRVILMTDESSASDDDGELYGIIKLQNRDFISGHKHATAGSVTLLLLHHTCFYLC